MLAQNIVIPIELSALGGQDFPVSLHFGDALLGFAEPRVFLIVLPLIPSKELSNQGVRFPLFFCIWAGAVFCSQKNWRYNAMFYIKSNLAKVAILITEITEENVFTRCPCCKEEIAVDLTEVIGEGDGDLYSTSVFCKACSQAMARELNTP